MNTQPISNLHHAPHVPHAFHTPKPWAWHLAPHQARAVPAATGARWLLVNAGQVWVTQARPTSASRPPEDIWLQAGDSLALPAGSAWVLEAWTEADLNLAETAPVPSATVKRGWRGLFSALFSTPLS
jgi:hypothetical protein